uniref:Uncharacterized protein n=1 Tax=Anguilla anguilla TaxID=7936 RepID=A0A0E9XH19_ANGAN
MFSGFSRLQHLFIKAENRATQASMEWVCLTKAGWST